MLAEWNGAYGPDIETLACAGRLHPALLAANLDRQLAELIQFGYGRDELCSLRDAVYAEVSSALRNRHTNAPS